MSETAKPVVTQADRGVIYAIITGAKSLSVEQAAMFVAQHRYACEVAIRDAAVALVDSYLMMATDLPVESVVEVCVAIRALRSAESDDG